MENMEQAVDVMEKVADWKVGEQTAARRFVPSQGLIAEMLRDATERAKDIHGDRVRTVRVRANVVYEAQVVMQSKSE